VDPPAVLEDPGPRVIADQQESMVDFEVDRAAVKDPALVGGPVAGVHQHGHGALATQLLRQEGAVTVAEGGDARDAVVAFADTAVLTPWCVGVSAGYGLSEIPDVGEVGGDVSSKAAEVAIGVLERAVHQLLLGKLKARGLAAVQYLEALVGGRGSEGKGRFAEPLVSDAGDGARLPPVQPSGRCGGDWTLHKSGRSRCVGGQLSKVGILELIRSEVRELVNSHLPGFGAVSVVPFHLDQVRSEQFTPVQNLRLQRRWLVKLPQIGNILHLLT
jgi:hypothetical protein